jgi:hypothetical protein
MLPKTILKLILGGLVLPAVLSVGLVSPAPAARPHVVDPCADATARGGLVERLAVHPDGSVGTVVARAC